MQKVSEWSHAALDTAITNAAAHPSPEQTSAADLIRKCLDPDPSARAAHFAEQITRAAVASPVRSSGETWMGSATTVETKGAEMKGILKHPFLTGLAAPDAKGGGGGGRDSIGGKPASANTSLSAARALRSLPDALVHELRISRRLLLQGLLQLSDARVPLGLVLLTAKLPEASEDGGLDALQLNDSGSAFETGQRWRREEAEEEEEVEEAPEVVAVKATVGLCEARLNEGLRWCKRLAEMISPAPPSEEDRSSKPARRPSMMATLVASTSS
jgi:hypothetical protein